MALVSVNDNTSGISRNRDELREKPVTKVDGSGTMIYNSIKPLINVDRITVLNLSNLLLKELPEDLPDLIHLNEINLSGNKLNNLPSKLISAKRLRILNLSRNNFSVVPQCLIIGLRTLKIIDLSENDLNNFDNPPACLPILKDLTLAHNRLIEIPQWIISDYKYILNTLDLSFNPCFENVKDFKKPPNNRLCGSLRNLKLINTNFTIVSLGLLLYFPTLLSLDISNCISGFKKSTLLNSLSALNIEYIPPELEELRMKDVRLTTLPDLSLLNKLKIIDVSANLLHWLPADESLSNSLCNIDLSRTVLMMLPDYIGNLKSLTRLMLSDNDLPSLPSSFNLLINLEVLDLYNNSMESLPDLKSFSRLKAFDICMNYFEPPTNLLVEGSPNYEDLKNTLRESNNFRNRSDSVKELVEDDIQDEYSSSRCSISPEYSNFAFPEVIVQSKKTEEEDWDLGNGNDDDGFDPTADNAYRKVIIDEIQNRDFGKNCLKYCPEEIRNSPHLFQPYAERSNSDCWKKQTNRLRTRRFSIVEGQFDDI